MDRRTNERTDEQKKPGIEVGAPPKNNLTQIDPSPNAAELGPAQPQLVPQLLLM